ncbi:hypothetical protein ABBQ32_004248 [Trebouxia sp. C0010 RCD-2024]
MSRKSLYVHEDFKDSASFGPTNLINVVSRGQNKSGSEVDEYLFLMHHFDPTTFKPMWWLSAQDVYLNDVVLFRDPYIGQDGPFCGQQAHSIVEMAARGMTAAEARQESIPSFPQARKLGDQQSIFGRIPLLPKANKITEQCDAGRLAQSLLLPALHRIGVKGRDADKLSEDILCKLLRNGKCCQYKDRVVSDENLSGTTKHQQNGLSLGSVRYGARTANKSLTMHNAEYHSVDENAQGNKGWRRTHVPTYEVLDSELVDQLIVPGIAEGRMQAAKLPFGNKEERELRHNCKKHLDWLHARKWTFFALAAVYYPTQKTHRIFKDQPFFQSEEAVRLFEELWIPLVHDSFRKGSIVYSHLCGPMGKHLLHAAQSQPGLDSVPKFLGDNADKLRLLDTLVAIVGSKRFSALQCLSSQKLFHQQKKCQLQQPGLLRPHQKLYQQPQPQRPRLCIGNSQSMAPALTREA